MSADTALSDDLRLEPSPFALVEDFDETDPPVAGGIAQPSRLLAAARLLAYAGLTLALLPPQVAFTALRLPATLTKFAQSALGQGLSREQVIEAIMQTAPYGGFPPALTALSQVKPVLFLVWDM